MLGSILFNRESMDSRFLQYVTSLFASFCLLITHYDLSSSVEHLLTMMPSDSDPSSSVEHSSTMIPFDSSSSVEQLRYKVLLTRNSFNLLSSIDQRARTEQSFPFLQGKRAS